MKIKFDEIKESIFPNFYYGKKETKAHMYIDELNRIMKGILPPGGSIGLHTHDKSSEIIIIISGTGKNICDDVEEILEPGDCHYCKKGSSHTLINTGNEDLVFYGIVPQQ